MIGSRQQIGSKAPRIVFKHHAMSHFAQWQSKKCATSLTSYARRARTAYLRIAEAETNHTSGVILVCSLAHRMGYAIITHIRLAEAKQNPRKRGNLTPQPGTPKMPPNTKQGQSSKRRRSTKLTPHTSTLTIWKKATATTFITLPITGTLIAEVGPHISTYWHLNANSSTFTTSP